MRRSRPGGRAVLKGMRIRAIGTVVWSDAPIAASGLDRSSAAAPTTGRIAGVGIGLTGRRPGSTAATPPAGRVAGVCIGDAGARALPAAAAPAAGGVAGVCIRDAAARALPVAAAPATGGVAGVGVGYAGLPLALRGWTGRASALAWGVAGIGVRDAGGRSARWGWGGGGWGRALFALDPLGQGGARQGRGAADDRDTQDHQASGKGMVGRMGHGVRRAVQGPRPHPRRSGRRGTRATARFWRSPGRILR